LNDQCENNANLQHLLQKNENQTAANKILVDFMFGFTYSIYIIKGVMFVYLSVYLSICRRWPAERLGRSRPNLP